MNQYEISGIKINIETGNGKGAFIKDRMRIFEKKHAQNPDMTITMLESDYIGTPSGIIKIIEPDNLNWLEKKDGLGFYGFKTRKKTNEILDMLETDKNWQSIKIFLLNADYYKMYQYNPIEVVAFHLIGTAFRNRILFNDGLVIHASSIIHEGRGLIFTAPSGTGKSTHAGLWELYRNASVLNDDTPAVRISEGKPYIYGSPWSGSSDKFMNAKATLNAIFILEQAPVNSVRRLSKKETVLRLMPRVFMPYFSDELTDMAVLNFERIIRDIPVYELKCRPDQEAVELAYKCV